MISLVIVSPVVARRARAARGRGAAFRGRSERRVFARDVRRMRRGYTDGRPLTRGRRVTDGAVCFLFVLLRAEGATSGATGHAAEDTDRSRRVMTIGVRATAHRDARGLVGTDGTRARRPAAGAAARLVALAVTARAARLAGTRNARRVRGRGRRAGGHAGGGRRR